MKRKVISLVGCSGMIISFTGCVIVDPLGSYLDKKSFDDRVDYYQKRGLDPQHAHRRAFEDDVVWDRDR